jgi:hypothetical protein
MRQDRGLWVAGEPWAIAASRGASALAQNGLTTVTPLLAREEGAVEGYVVGGGRG